MQNADFNLHHFPQQEKLAELLLDNLASEGEGCPFHKSTVLVRNQGMATWLRQRIAAKNGLAMLVDFPQPNTFLQALVDEKSVQLDELKWPIYQLLPTLLDKPEFSILKTYLSSSTTEIEASLKRYQLSSQIAALYDKYLLYRPEWITAWNAGESIPAFSSHEAWQRILWLELSQNHIQHWSQSLLAAETLEIDVELPSALHVFGISNFAPIYVRFLYLLSQRIPVHIYWMNPVSIDEGYWEDAPTKRQWTMAEAFDESCILTEGNPLLASFGRMGREFVHTLYGGESGNTEIHNYQPQETTHPAAINSLQQLQQSIYNRRPMSDSSPIDSSLSVHSCHTPLRELETLKDYLLRLAEKAPLDTGDVIVLCPDIAAYAPSIEAVFGSLQRQQDFYLPYRISDRSAPINEPAIAAIAQLFDLNKKRFTNREALDLLSVPAIAEHLNLSELDLSTIREWVTKSGIRWGFDFKHVLEVAPDCSDSSWTWRDGLDRLLLGYAMPSKELTLWRNILPYHDIEGSSTRLLGSLCSFVEWCGDIRNQLSERRTLADWVVATKEWIDLGFSMSPDAQQSIQPLLQLLEKLHEQSALIEETIPSDVFSEHLKDYLNDSSPAFGFLNGSITFCETKPMRAIPARVICLLGMNHDAFPRTSSDVQFDLIKDSRQAGDRSTRDDDCYFFLEAILSARENLYFSYVGTSIKDGEPRPPSTALQTLIDTTPGLAKAVVREKLHAYDPAYFQGEPRSHDTHLMQAADTLNSTAASKEPRAELSIPVDQLPTHIEIEDFIAGLTRSTSHFLKKSLQARRHYYDAPLVEDEPLEINGLVGWELKNQLLQTRHFDSTNESAWRQQGLIPSGEFGHLQLVKQLGSITTFLKDLPEQQITPVEIIINNIHITGSVPTHSDGHVLSLSPSKKPKGRDLMQLWIYQLLISQATEQPTAGLIINIDKQLVETHLTPPESPQNTLKFLLQIYLDNLNSPQANFPETSYAISQVKRKETDSEDDFEQTLQAKAIKSWSENSEFKTGEGHDPEIALFFTASALSSETFHAIYEKIWQPLSQAILPAVKN